MISIKSAKKIREDLGLTHIVIFGISDDGMYHVATHGKTKINAKEAAYAGNRLKKSLSWPDELCNTEPLERVCGNCESWAKRDFQLSGNYPPEFYKGDCCLEPTKVFRMQNDIACRHF